MNILFVCTGNTCRSVMAQRLFWRRAAKLGLRAEARSAGIAAERYFPQPQGVRMALERHGIEDARHVPRLVGRPAMDWATHVYAMAANHLEVLRELYPEHRKKTFLFLEAAGLGRRDVEDPIGRSDERYVECSDVIAQGVENLARQLHEPLRAAKPRS